MIQVNNPHNRISFFNRDTNSVHECITALLTADKIRTSSVAAHEYNISNFVPRPDQYREVIHGIVPIPPRSRWLFDGNTFFSNNSSMTLDQGKSNLLAASKRLLATLDGKKIAVELSGGLDTGVIIGLLDHLGIEPTLIGSRSSKYEFRTESIIQEILSRRFLDSHLLPKTKSLPFSDLLCTPVHQLPSSTSLFHAHSTRIAALCSELSINILLSGMGLDILFCEETQHIGNQGPPDTWSTWMLDDNWFNEYIFEPRGICYKSAAASTSLIRTIWSMRRCQKEDVQKWWARDTFSDFLPAELSKFAYKADNSGDFIDGLLTAEKDIQILFKAIYELTKFDQFNQNSFNSLVGNAIKNDNATIKTIMARVSFANWIYGLAKAF